MYRAIAFCAALGTIGGLSAHQFTPTYPEIETSYIPGVSVVNMSIFNSRQEIDWYSIGVYDSNWNSIAFNYPTLGEKIYLCTFVKVTPVRSLIYVQSQKP